MFASILVGSCVERKNKKQTERKERREGGKEKANTGSLSSRQ